MKILFVDDMLASLQVKAYKYGKVFFKSVIYKNTLK